MELHHIQYFVAAAEELNISKASRRVHVSQPAMSRQIRDLEAELGVALFERERFGLRLTGPGETFLAYARKIVGLVAEAGQAVRGRQAAQGGLKLGFLSSSLCSFLGESLRRFRIQYPTVEVRIHELSPAEQVVALRRRRIDLALLGDYRGAFGDEFATRTLFTLDLKAVVPQKHRLARRQAIDLAELADEAFVGYCDDTFAGHNQMMMNACAPAHFNPRITSQSESLLEMLAMIGTGAGVCLMPEDAACLPHPNVVFIRIKQQVRPIQYTAAWRHDDTRPLLQDLLACIELSRNGRPARRR